MGYVESEWVAARVAACFALFVTKKFPVDAALANYDMTGTTEDGDAHRIEKLAPGIIEYLESGEEVQSFSPQRPGGSFEPFIRSAIQFIGAGLGLPYELVLKDFTRTNYSSARAALLEARRAFRRWQQTRIRYICQPTWELLVEEQAIRGELPVRDWEKTKYAYTRALWIPPGWDWVDPLKEAKASAESIAQNLSTHADECSTKGKDWEEVARQRAREKNLYQELGLEAEAAVESEESIEND
jgi:lambda family phage portal protein